MTINQSKMAMAPRLAVALAACTLLATPHGSVAEVSTTRTPDVVVTSPGILETSAAIYGFTPTTCLIHIEDGVADIEVHGPGLAPDGESLYFDLSSTANEITIELGVDEPYASVGRKLRAGQYVSTAFEVDVTDGIISVANLDLVDGQGEPVDAHASLRIDCNT